MVRMIENDKFAKLVAKMAITMGSKDVNENHIVFALMLNQEFGVEYNKYNSGYLNWVELINKISSLIKNEFYTKDEKINIDDALIMSKKLMDSYHDIDSTDEGPSGINIMSHLSKKEELYINKILTENYGETLEPFVYWYKTQKKPGKRELVVSKKRKINEGEQENSSLNKWCVNLNKKAAKGELDEVINRESEIDRVESVLLRRKKSNPVIVGEAGVGKSAVVEGLALNIYNKKCSDKLKDCEIYSLSYGAIMAGTRYRGDLEDRVQGIIDELRENKNLILFIDEIHLIMKDEMDIAEMLKPELARGDIRCIGATTFGEWRKYFSKSGAMARRFGKVVVKEPSKEDTFVILNRSKAKLEEYYGIKISTKLIREIVNLSGEYISDNKYPDKAFDVADEVGVAVAKAGRKRTKLRDVYKVIESITGRIPVGVYNKGVEYFEELCNLAKKEIIGQDNVIDEIMDHMLVMHSGLGGNNKTMGVFLFRGVSGVGKSALAKTLSKITNKTLIKLDMGEYSDGSAVSKLIGASPGYVGYEDGGALIEKVTANPNAIILMDEIEKAHPVVLNSILSLLEDGVMTDGQGRECDFSGTTVIMSSNAGSDAENKGRLGFGKEDNKRVDSAVKKIFSPEFYNRIDLVLNFNKLNIENISIIIKNTIETINDSLKGKELEIKITDECLHHIALKSLDKKLGARPVGRNIHKYIKKPLSLIIMNGTQGLIEVGIKDDKVILYKN
jgi:ATP-dependent Clp protease ATP-binding subunit ClpA